MAPSFSKCCVESFAWDGTPTGHEGMLGDNKAYIVGDNKNAAVLLAHDALGWKFDNARLLADHFAKEANVTVYLPDFFGGEGIDAQAVKEGRWADIDMKGFAARNSRAIREPELFAAASLLRKQYKKVGAIGYCWGGWAVLRLAAQTHETSDTGKLVDCIVLGHPSWVTEADIDGVGDVAVQILAPEVDMQFSDEMKLYAFRKLVVERKGLPVEYVHFPGVSHGCLTKGGEGDKEAMVRGKDAAVKWFRMWLGN